MNILCMGCAAKVPKPWPYLRIKEAKTDTLFRPEAEKLHPIQGIQTTANALCKTQIFIKIAN